MRYDIEIAVPVSCNGKYKQRISDFLKYGLLNKKDKKVVVKLLTGPNDEITEVNPDVDIEIIKFKHDDPASKIYSYYANITELNSRWYAKFDDDSINDISCLVDSLDMEYDWDRDYYIVTELRKETQKIELDILTTLGFQRWVTKGSKPILHEWEGSVVSHSAMHKIISNETSKQLLKMRSEVHAGWGDLCLAYAARINKIYASETDFMTVNPTIEGFSLFGGRLAHIHRICHDTNMNKLMFLKKSLNNEIVPEEAWEQIKNKKYLFYRKNHLGDIAPISIVSFLKSGSFVGSLNLNETFWTIAGKELYLLNNNCNSTTIMTIDNYEKMKGTFLFDRNITHYLEVINDED